MPSVSEILGWKAEGRAEGMVEGMALGMQEARRSDLLKVLRVRFPDLPYDIATSIRGMTDIDQLSRWLEAAVVAPSVAVFRSMANDADSRSAYR